MLMLASVAAACRPMPHSGGHSFDCVIIVASVEPASVLACVATVMLLAGATGSGEPSVPLHPVAATQTTNAKIGRRMVNLDSSAKLGLELVVPLVGDAGDGVEHVDELVEVERLERAQRAQIDAPRLAVDGERAVLGGQIVELEQAAVELFAAARRHVHDRRE